MKLYKFIGMKYEMVQINNEALYNYNFDLALLRL